MNAVDGVSIGYQVFGEGPYDLVLNDGWMGNLYVPTSGGDIVGEASWLGLGR